jgi:Phage integrase family
MISDCSSLGMQSQHSTYSPPFSVPSEW